MVVLLYTLIEFVEAALKVGQSTCGNKSEEIVILLDYGGVDAKSQRLYLRHRRCQQLGRGSWLLHHQRHLKYGTLIKSLNIDQKLEIYSIVVARK